MDLYKSRHAALRVVVRKQLDKRHPVTGDVIETTPAIRAEFGTLGPEYTFRNPHTGEMDTAADIRGGTYDLDAAASQAGYSDDEKAMIKRRLDSLCQQQPEMIQRVDYVVLPAEIPWPTYDTFTDPDALVTMAETLGLASKALAYERENLERPAVIEALEAFLLVKPEPEPAPEPVIAITAPVDRSESLPRVIVA